jgi:RNA polymerase sigma-70 factor (ECF subfamily)
MRLDRAVARRVDASDVVQEALIDAHRRLGDYLKRSDMPFHLWLRRIALDRVIDAHRRHRVAKRRSVDREKALASPAFDDRSSIDLLQHLADQQLTPAAAALRTELARRFQAAIEELPDDDREVIIMRHFEGLSNQEVASALELSEPAAGMRHLRALRKLRKVIEADGGSSLDSIGSDS